MGREVPSRHLTITRTTDFEEKRHLEGDMKPLSEGREKTVSDADRSKMKSQTKTPQEAPEL